MKSLIQLGLFLLLNVSSLSVFASESDSVGSKTRLKINVTKVCNGKTCRIFLKDRLIPGEVVEFKDPKAGTKYTGTFVNDNAPILAFRVYDQAS